jgi:hypothetical protein
MNRRQFTRTFATLTGGGALAAGLGLSATLCLLRDTPPSLSRAFFQAHLGERFRTGESGAHSLQLTKVVTASPYAPDSQFHAIFEAGPQTRIEEGIHRLESMRSGRFDLFLTQSGFSGTRQQYVATINLQTAA